MSTFGNEYNFTTNYSFSHLHVSEEDFPKLEADGYLSYLISFPFDGGYKVFQVYILDGKAKDFVNAKTSVEKYLNKRPSSKLRKRTSTKGKK